MSEFLSAAAQAMNAPEVLVLRSAEARAKAVGGSADDFLKAWAGGGTVAVAPAPAVTEPEPAPAPAAEPAPASAPEQEPARAPEAIEPAAAAVAVVEAPVELEEPMEAVPLRDRMRRSGRVGAIIGLASGLLSVLFGAQWLLPRATTLDVDGTMSAAIDVVPGRLVLGFGLVSLVVGVLVAGGARLVTGWYGRGMRLVGGPWGTVAVGGVVGFLVGALIAGVIIGSGTPNDLVEGVTTIPASSSVLWAILGWFGGGWLIGILVQTFGVPAGVESEEAEESTGVKGRLATAFSLPPLAALAILVLVLPVAYVFISFPAWAPIVGVFIAGSILGFAGLSASRPGLKISVGDFLVAAAGIGVIVIIIVAVLTAQGAGHGEGEHGDDATTSVVVV